ncbi:MAG: response regulator, partial [Candidatus Hydrogenedentes bacterium]|nr:response regulator [Candidatus Hydrogenedentota bacterium]
GQAAFWWRLDVTWPLIPAFLLHFVLLFTRPRRRISPLLLTVIYAPALLFLILAIEGLHVTAPPEKMWWGYAYGIPKESFWVRTQFLWGISAGLTAVTICFWYAFKTSSQWRKRQAGLIGLGILFPYLASIGTDVLFRRMYGRYPAMAYSMFVITAVLIMYAIWKYHAFDLTPRRIMDTILTTMPDAMFLADANGEITVANPAAANLLGCDLTEVVGLPLDQVLPEIAHMPGTAPHAPSGNGSPPSLRRHDTQVMTRNKQRISVDLSWSHVSDPAGKPLGTVFVAHDITRRIRNETQLARQRDHLEQLVAQRTFELDASNARLYQAQKMQAMGQLAGGVAHDFNNLLTAILGNLSLAQSEETVTTIRSYIDQANRAGLRAADLVQQLLAFSRKSQVVIQAVDIGSVFNEIEKIVRQTFDRRIEIAFMCPPNLPKVRADAGQVHQVILNLCVNARDALDEVQRRRDTRELRITVEARPATIKGRDRSNKKDAKGGELICISVSDTGTGISPHVRDRIFEPFFTTKGAGKGTGLGLATAYSIVERHGGWIDLETVVGTGSTFLVYLPVHSKPATVNTSQDRRLQLPEGSESVLIVDDEPAIRSLGKDMLERLGYTVKQAADGRQCLHILFDKKVPIDLVILDLSMPELSGYEVLSEIRRRALDIPVIISSGYPQTTLEPELMAMGAVAFVNKPFSLESMALSIRRALDDRITHKPAVL